VSEQLCGVNTNFEFLSTKLAVMDLKAPAD